MPVIDVGPAVGNTHRVDPKSLQKKRSASTGSLGECQHQVNVLSGESRSSNRGKKIQRRRASGQINQVSVPKAEALFKAILCAVRNNHELRDPYQKNEKEPVYIKITDVENLITETGQEEVWLISARKVITSATKQYEMHDRKQGENRDLRIVTTAQFQEIEKQITAKKRSSML